MVTYRRSLSKERPDLLAWLIAFHAVRGLGTGVEIVDLRTSPAQQSRYTMPCSPLLRRSYFETVVAETFLSDHEYPPATIPPFTPALYATNFLRRLDVKAPFMRLGIGCHARHVCFEFAVDMFTCKK